MTEEEIEIVVDAAMVEMENIHPPLRRSECKRLIQAAIAALDKHREGKDTERPSGPDDHGFFERQTRAHRRQASLGYYASPMKEEGR